MSERLRRPSDLTDTAHLAGEVFAGRAGCDRESLTRDPPVMDPHPAQRMKKSLAESTRPLRACRCMPVAPRSRHGSYRCSKEMDKDPSGVHTVSELYVKISIFW